MSEGPSESRWSSSTEEETTKQKILDGVKNRFQKLRLKKPAAKVPVSGQHVTEKVASFTREGDTQVPAPGSLTDEEPEMNDAFDQHVTEEIANLYRGPSTQVPALDLVPEEEPQTEGPSEGYGTEKVASLDGEFATQAPAPVSLPNEEPQEDDLSD
ncbi:hypothetical protein E4U54_003994 [Claviceps lovelessii]|nr:hypothetical protein E4U54_003994 [Claviceps lovelessii]